MNCMTDMWSVFGRDQGQMVEVAYRYHDETDRIICRITDRSGPSVSYQAAPCPDDVEWVGSEGVAPFDDLDWSETTSPFHD